MAGEIGVTAAANGGSAAFVGPPDSSIHTKLKLPADTGAAGKVLKIKSANHSSTNAELEWAADAGGKVLQTARTSTKIDGFSTTSDQVDITGTDQAGSGSVWCCKITPTAATSKILFLGTITGHHTTFHGGIWAFRDSTEIAYAAASGSNRQRASYSMGVGSSDSTTRNVTQAFTLNWLDSPSSTSELTYKFQVGDHGEGGTTYINMNANPDDWAGTWLSISSITLLEIGA